MQHANIYFYSKDKKCTHFQKRERLQNSTLGIWIYNTMYNIYKTYTHIYIFYM